MGDTVSYMQPGTSRHGIALKDNGWLDEPFPKDAQSSLGSSALTSQRLYVCQLGAFDGDIISGIGLNVQTAAAGTAPTRVKACLLTAVAATAIGTVQAVTADVQASLVGVTKDVILPFTAPYTKVGDGSVFAGILLNGAYGTTQPSLLRGLGSGSSAAHNAASGKLGRYGTVDGVTDLAVNDTPNIVFGGTNAISFWLPIAA
jgi:hypothetical protein